MTAPGMEATPLSCAATSFLMKLIFSRLRRQGECGQRHNWRGGPVITQKTVVRAPARAAEWSVARVREPRQLAYAMLTSCRSRLGELSCRRRRGVERGDSR